MPTITCDRYCLIGQPVSPWDKIALSNERIVPFTPPHHCTRTENRQPKTDFHYKLQNVATTTPSAHHVLALQTAPRPMSTLQQTINSLRSAGSDEWLGPKILMGDGCLPLVPSGWINMSAPPPSRGSAKTFLKLLKSSTVIDPNLEFLTYIQDDVLLCQNALNYMARIKLPEDASLLTWFTYPYDYSYPPWESPAFPASANTPTIALRPTRFFILGQAFTLPRKSIESLLYCPHVAREWPKLNGMDEMPAWTFGDAPYATHFPNLVQHTGETTNSACFLILRNRNPTLAIPPCDDKTSPYFPGVDFDALSLLRDQ
jgi:hypothetical protein